MAAMDAAPQPVLKMTQSVSLPASAASPALPSSIPNLPSSRPPVAAPITPTAQQATPHIALILPTHSPLAAIARYAVAVHQGFMAAATVEPGLPVQLYESSEEDKEISALYRQALANGAQAVAGPLTRNGVAALAAEVSVNVPTLALNQMASPLKTQTQLYFFGLSADREAIEMAQLAATSKVRNAVIVRNDSPQSLRLSGAFAKAWQQQGRRISNELSFQGNPASLGKLPENSLIFLALETESARLLRPYIHPGVPIYGTSQLFKGNADKMLNFDLNDIRFIDMPWLLQPDHPAVMVYPKRISQMFEADMERMYALGIDAYRVLQFLLTHPDADLTLDGVTGELSLSNQIIQRKQLPAFFKQGLGLTPEALAQLNAAKAAAKAAEGNGFPAPQTP